MNKGEGQLFVMPDRTILTTYSAIDRYYNLRSGTTAKRARSGWTREEYLTNRGVNTRYLFKMPDGTILGNCKDVDRYHNMTIEPSRGNLPEGWTEDNEVSVTALRLGRGWTPEECANNSRNE